MHEVTHTTRGIVLNLYIGMLGPIAEPQSRHITDMDTGFGLFSAGRNLRASGERRAREA